MEMTDRELMQQALDALDYPGPSWPDARQKAAKALRARLAQPEQRTGDCLLVGVCAAEGHRIQKAETARQPVAWLTDREEMYFDREDAKRYSDGFVQPLYTALPQREWQSLTDDDIAGLVGLVDTGKTAAVYGLAGFARAVERALKEKNEWK